MRDARWAWVLTCCTLGSCGGRHEVGIEDGALGGGGSGGSAGGSMGGGSSGSAGSSMGGASSATDSTSATGSTSTTASSTTSTGAGGSGSLPPVDDCVTTSMKPCGQAVCHSAGVSKTAGLNLTATALLTNYKALYYDKLNAGVGDPDPMYCQPGSFKLIDSANPKQSLIYAKLLTSEEREAGMIPPCGAAMPIVGVPLTDADKACILSWINGVITGSEAQR